MKKINLSAIFLACISSLAIASQSPSSRTALSPKSPTATANLDPEVRGQAEALRDAYRKLADNAKAPSKAFALGIIAEHTDTKDMWKAGVVCLKDEFERNKGNKRITILCTKYRQQREQTIGPTALEEEGAQHFDDVSSAMSKIITTDDKDQTYFDLGALAKPILYFYAPREFNPSSNHASPSAKTSRKSPTAAAATQNAPATTVKSRSPGRRGKQSDSWYSIDSRTLKAGAIGAILGIGVYEIARRYFKRS